ncbi:metallo-beta-lactamase superfamily protein [Colletotrichum cuscutae]|uniref:Metallo-beta-lactamase superfamily protein n=1 Tax=Colletotrichum cuscutae TaxID=1209917 RepID=A0AAI9YAF8_9PEZI|nr:metallo-beta-lactamase superfamily protein [Colletotrichum cuscutae]
MEGAVPNQWPASFKPSILQPTGGLNGPWNQSYPITEDGKVVAVDTPGHVPGHLSVIVRADDVSYLLLGDATYDQDLLDQELTDGVNSNPALAVDSLRKIKEFSRSGNVVLLPAHDPQAAHRLTEEVIYCCRPYAEVELDFQSDIYRPNMIEGPLNQGSLYTTPGLLLVLFGTVVFFMAEIETRALVTSCLRSSASPISNPCLL